MQPNAVWPQGFGNRSVFHSTYQTVPRYTLRHYIRCLTSIELIILQCIYMYAHHVWHRWGSRGSMSSDTRTAAVAVLSNTHHLQAVYVIRCRIHHFTFWGLSWVLHKHADISWYTNPEIPDVQRRWDSGHRQAQCCAPCILSGTGICIRHHIRYFPIMIYTP